MGLKIELSNPAILRRNDFFREQINKKRRENNKVIICIGNNSKEIPSPSRADRNGMTLCSQ